VAAELVRNETVSTLPQGARFKYAGSVPFGTLARGDHTVSELRAPAVFRESTAWREFWRGHAGSDDGFPDVDFRTDMVIVGILGEREEAGDSVEVRRILQVEDGTLAEVFERIPGNFCSPAERRHVPYHFVVAPRTPLPIRFAENLPPELPPCGG
jgi:hypothetical protein